MRTSVRLAFTLAGIGCMVALWFAATRGSRQRESEARVHLVIPIDLAKGTAEFNLDWSKWPHSKGGAQLMLANRSEFADVADQAALERERRASDALIHESIHRGDESREPLELAPPLLLIRMRVRDVEGADPSAMRNRYAEADEEGWVTSWVSGWPIRCSWGLGLLEPAEGKLTRVEFERIEGPTPPEGTAPSILVEGERDSEMRESADVGFTVVNFAFGTMLLLVAFAALVHWANARRAVDLANLGPRA